MKRTIFCEFCGKIFDIDDATMSQKDYDKLDLFNFVENITDTIMKIFKRR